MLWLHLKAHNVCGHDNHFHHDDDCHACLEHGYHYLYANYKIFTIDDMSGEA